MNWQRIFFYRKESLRTTWTLRLSLLLAGILAAFATRTFWTAQIGESLACREQIPGRSDALLVENFDLNYLVFERAAALERSGLSARVLVPAQVSRQDPEDLNLVSKRIAEVMAGVARLRHIELIPIQEKEPISLNAAYQIRDFLIGENLRSLVVVTPGFRSRRSFLVYESVLAPAGIAVSCVPVFGAKTAGNWASTWHGIQEVALQFLKLQYYRFYVLWQAKIIGLALQSNYAAVNFRGDYQPGDSDSRGLPFSLAGSAADLVIRFGRQGPPFGLAL